MTKLDIPLVNKQSGDRIIEQYVASTSDGGWEKRVVVERGNANPAERLEYLRGELRAEQISYGEVAELQGLAKHIDPGDVELLEAAGVPEYPEDEDT